jgi:hypothetical protein
MVDFDAYTKESKGHKFFFALLVKGFTFLNFKLVVFRTLALLKNLSWQFDIVSRSIWSGFYFEILLSI